MAGPVSRLGTQSERTDVAKKSKIETPNQADGKSSDPIGANAGAEPKAIGAALKPGRKKKKASPKKKSVRAVKPVARKKAPGSVSAPAPTDEEIRIRAYFIAERRMQLSLQGDSAHDWIEARRQLIEEARGTVP